MTITVGGIVGILVGIIFISYTIKELIKEQRQKEPGVAWYNAGDLITIIWISLIVALLITIGNFVYEYWDKTVVII